MAKFKAKIIQVDDLSSDVRNYKLEIVDVGVRKNFSFLPGQFVIIKDKNEGGKEVAAKRSYSIASSPDEKKYFELCIKLEPDGKLTPKLFELSKGDILDCEGPFGNFVFEDPEGRDVLFIAGGTGIAPIRSMLNYAINNNIGKIITLFFSFRGHKQFLYSDEFEEILEKNSKRFRLVVSNTDNSDEEWDGLYGRLQEHISAYVDNCDNKNVYMCGSPEFVKEISEVLFKLGFTKEQIRKEVWS